MLPKILIIGCNKDYIKHFSETCIVIDSSTESFEETKEIKPKNEYVKGDLTNMPFDKNYFDKVICIDVLQSTEHHKKIISEIKRVLV